MTQHFDSQGASLKPFTFAMHYKIFVAIKTTFTKLRYNVTMKSFSSIFACLFLSYLSSIVVKAELYDSFYDRFSCPDPYEFVEENPDYDIDCVENSIPPWPICLFHNVTYFIDAAVSSASRCCDFENLDDCGCPLKYKEKWQAIMTEWCPKIDTCPEPEGGVGMSPLVTETWTGNLMQQIAEYDEAMSDAEDEGYDGGEDYDAEDEGFNGGEDYDAYDEDEYYDD